MSSEYVPNGFADWIFTGPGGTDIRVRLMFTGWPEFKSMFSWAMKHGFKPSSDPINPISVMDLIPSKNSAPSCPVHGPGKWVKSNKGRGSHKFYCAWSLDQGGYCGKKID